MTHSNSKSTHSKKVTLKDIADTLGISKATVSLCINESPLVATKTRQRVMEKIEQLGYVYNRRAASLATGETNTVGLAVHDITSPYFTHICAGVEKVLSQNGRMSFLCNSNESLERQRYFIDTLIEHNADGILLCPAAGTTAEMLKSLLKQKLPAVLITREIEGVSLDFVGNDERLSMHMATRHLINLGHTRIAFLGGNYDSNVARERRAGFTDAMKLNGIKQPTDWLFDCDNTEKAGEKMIAKMLKLERPPTAVVGFSDRVALGVISGLIGMELKPGKDIAVVGCDDIDESSRSYAQLTTMRIHKARIGQVAADFLIQRLKNPELPRQRMIFEPELIIRSSCGSQLKTV